jgi:AAA family ATP:ADP antiporter
MSALTPPTISGRVSPRGTWLHRLVLLEPGEAPAFLWSAAYFFFLLFSYYLLRPVRDEMGVRGDLDTLPWLWSCTTLATLIVAPLFAWMTARLPQRRFVPMVYRIIALSLVLFWILLTSVGGPHNQTIAYVFFVWVSVYNLLSTSVFWGFMAGMYRREQGKRLFGAIGVGGTLGAIAGSAVPATLAHVLGSVNLLLGSALLLEVVAQCVNRLTVARASRPGESRHGRDARATDIEPSRSIWAGFALVAKSPYLQMIAVYMLLFTLTSTFLYLEQARIIKTSIADPDERTRIFAMIDLAVNVLTLLTQLFVTGRILTHLGLTFGLAFLPALTLAGFTGLWRIDTIGMLMAVQTVRRAMHYAVDRPTREVLYTVLSPDARYKSKSFIDTFIYRAGDLLGAGGTALAEKFALAIAALAIPASVAWVGVSLALGLMQKREANRATSVSGRSAGGAPSVVPPS